MEQTDLFSVVDNMARGIAKLMGSDTEVVVHDLEVRRIVSIYNGAITGRSLDYQPDPLVYDTVFDLADEEGQVIGLASQSKDGKPLRSSHFIIKDKAGAPKLLMCINQDISKLEALRAYLDEKASVHSPSGSKDPSGGLGIPLLVRQLIFDAVQKHKPSALNTKEAKLDVIRTLEAKGIFSVKDSVPIVCKLLSVSQATLYNYLRELRNENETIAEIGELKL